MSKHIVTGIRPFNFANKDGEKVEGVTVYYLDTHNENSDYVKGYTVLKLNFMGDNLDKFKQLPGVYEMDFRQVADPKGQPVLRLQNLAFVKSFNLEVL